MNNPTLNQLISSPSCVDDYDPNAMSVSQAKAFIQQFLSPVESTETITIHESLGRVLSKNIISPSNVPNHNNSAMDGFAYKFEDTNKPLRIVGSAFAGRPYADNIQSGECVKIMTGAVIPKGADTVVMQERTTTIDNTLTITEMPQKGANIRLAGEDLRLGEVVLSKGHLMRPADLGLIASLGVAKVEVYRQLKVAFFSTGDELAGVGKPLEEGQIYDSNRYTLYGMLTKIGVKISDLGAIPDQVDLLEETLIGAASTHDVVITSGGVSVGEADHMKALLAKHGQVLFWKINMKPGRPLAYGKVNHAHYFGLPGNPVATMVSFYQFVRDALLTIMGAKTQPIPLFNVECTMPIKKAKGRTEFVRGLLYIDNNTWKVKPTGNQSSGVLSSMSKANCFIVLEEEVGNCDAGTHVKVQVFEGVI